MQGGSASLQETVDAMPTASKDMLANRRATMVTAKSGLPAPVVSRVPASVLAEASSSTPARTNRHIGTATPAVSRLPRDLDAGSNENPPAVKGTPRAVASPSSRLPKSSISPSISRAVPVTSVLPRAHVAPIAQSRLQRPSDVLGVSAEPTMQPVTRGLSTRPLSNGNGHRDVVIAAINDIWHDDPDRSVDALKRVQDLLANQPDTFLDNVQTLADALMDETDRAFTPPDNLLNPRYFRLVKHLIQTFSGFSSNQSLMGRSSYDDVYSMLSGLSLRLVQCDRMGGAIQELAKFINMILLQILATPDRLLVFRAMFRLLLSLRKDFSTRNEQPDTEVAAHADLVLKCLWKRYKVLDDDLRSGRLECGPLMAVLEEFMQGVSPAEYRQRAVQGIALGDMPLRTVKTIIQRILGAVASTI